MVSLKVQYIDGTKIESVANKYTFVWKGSIFAVSYTHLDVYKRQVVLDISLYPVTLHVRIVRFVTVSGVCHDLIALRRCV